jgi:hypothetical protein
MADGLRAPPGELPGLRVRTDLTCPGTALSWALYQRATDTGKGSTVDLLA